MTTEELVRRIQHAKTGSPYQDVSLVEDFVKGRQRELLDALSVVRSHLKGTTKYPRLYDKVDELLKRYGHIST